MNVSQPRSKVLVAFENRDGFHTVDRREILEQIFDLDAYSTQENIVKNLIWKTKYYQCQYDLYIDEFEEPESWLADLNSADFAELRAVLAGVILVKSYDPRSQTHTAILRQLSGIECRDSFLIWCNTNREVDEEAIDSANRAIWPSNVNTEIVNWHCIDSVNEYGEKGGLERLKEIIDTHQWAKVDTAGTREVVRSERDDGDQMLAENLEAVVGKLQRARRHFQSLNDKEDEASTFAMAMAEEIADLL